MAVAVQDLTTIIQLETWLGISTGTYDTELQLIISSVSLMMEKYCRTQLAKRASAMTEYRDGDGTNIIFPYNIPIVSITSIYDDPDRTYGSTTLISSDDYVYYDRKIVLTNGVFQRGGGSSSKNIKLTYFAGYAATLPTDLRMACEIICKQYWDVSHNGRNVANIKSMSDESGSVTFDASNPYNWPKEALSLLNPYRRKFLV